PAAQLAAGGRGELRYRVRRRLRQCISCRDQFCDRDQQRDYDGEIWVSLTPRHGTLIYWECHGSRGVGIGGVTEHIGSTHSISVRSQWSESGIAVGGHVCA